MQSVSAEFDFQLFPFTLQIQRTPQTLQAWRKLFRYSMRRPGNDHIDVPLQVQYQVQEPERTEYWVPFCKSRSIDCPFDRIVVERRDRTVSAPTSNLNQATPTPWTQSQPGIMDSRIGLDYIVENRDYISKLGSALDTQNATVKKQVFELLSALCAYNSEGYARAIETLEFYKVRNPGETVKKSLHIFMYYSLSLESQKGTLSFQNRHQRAGTVQCRHTAAFRLSGHVAGLH